MTPRRLREGLRGVGERPTGLLEIFSQRHGTPPNGGTFGRQPDPGIQAPGSSRGISRTTPETARRRPRDDHQRPTRDMRKTTLELGRSSVNGHRLAVLLVMGAAVATAGCGALLKQMSVASATESFRDGMAAFYREGDLILAEQAPASHP